LPTTGAPIVQLVLKQSPVSSKIVLVAQSNNSFLSGYVCMHDCTNVINWDTTLNIANTNSTTTLQRRFDIAFESNTGNMLLIYGVNSTNTSRDLGYKILYESNMSFNGLNEQYIDDSVQASDVQYSWVTADRDPVNTSNEIIITGFDLTNNDINAWVWNGTAWGNQRELTATATGTGGYEALAVKYASDGSKGMVVGGTGAAGAVNWQYWSAGAWTAGTFDTNGVSNNDVGSLSLKPNPSSAAMQLVDVETQRRLLTHYWNGTAWSTIGTVIDNAVDVNAQRCADFEWMPTGSTGVLVWDSDTTGNLLNQTVCNPTCSAAGMTTVPSYAGTGKWITLFANPTVTDYVHILGIRMNSTAAGGTPAIGAFFYNGSNYTNYGDNAFTSVATAVTYEAYSFGFRRDLRPPSITFISPNASGIILKGGIGTSVFFNVSSNEFLYNITLEFNGTANYSMNGSGMNWNYTFNNLAEGFYSYKAYSIDLAGNLNISYTWNFTVNYPPYIILLIPQNNTLNTTSRNITFYYNVTDALDNVSVCSLIIDKIFVLNTSAPINKSSTQNFTYLLSDDQHNWSIWCNDSNNFNYTSETWNITVKLLPVIQFISLDDFLLPDGDIILSAGYTRNVNCSAVIFDPEGISDIRNVTARFYYYLNKSSDSDDNNTHYSNNNCTLASNTSVNATFNCGFNILYYANNGTWICNLTVYNNYSNNASTNISNYLQPLYALNVTDGVEFSNVPANSPSGNITVNITNFGNMDVNVSIQGYALVIGDNKGMNCSDGSTINITNIRFSTNNTANFQQKTPMNGAIQQLKLQVKKQTNGTQIFNTTYWQITPDPGVMNRICNGSIIFNSQAP